MAFTEGCTPSTLNGLTVVDVVAAPAAATRRLVRSVLFHNPDTVERTIALRYDDNGTVRIIEPVTLQPGETWEHTRLLVLDSVDRKLSAVAGEAASVTEVTAVATWADST